MQWIEANDFDFIVTGEVVGQRPMSQRRDTMPVIARDSGAADRLVRPLCAKNLPETLPEREGWLDRDRLYAFSGRSRKPQMALAGRIRLHGLCAAGRRLLLPHGQAVFGKTGGSVAEPRPA